MTAQLILRCDGTPTERPDMALERCRAFYTGTTMAEFQATGLSREGIGWTIGYADGRWLDFCPACAGAWCRNQEEAP